MPAFAAAMRRAEAAPLLDGEEAEAAAGAAGAAGAAAAAARGGGAGGAFFELRRR
jgi:hypothetical protein